MPPSLCFGDVNRREDFADDVGESEAAFVVEPEHSADFVCEALSFGVPFRAVASPLVLGVELLEELRGLAFVPLVERDVVEADSSCLDTEGVSSRPPGESRKDPVATVSIVNSGLVNISVILVSP